MKVCVLCVLGYAQHVALDVEHLRKVLVHLGFYHLDVVAQTAQLWYGCRHLLVHHFGISLAVGLALCGFCLFLLLGLKSGKRFGLFCGHFDLYFLFVFHCSKYCLMVY